MGFPETDHEQGSHGPSHRNAIKTSFGVCWFKPPHKCHWKDECGVVNDCAKCGNNDHDCDSDDCTMWEGKCRLRDVGEGFKMGEWYYYAGPSRPFRATGDTARFGAKVQVIGPGKDKPGAQMTEAEKSPDRASNKKSWKLVYFPGNLRYVKVKTLSKEPPPLPEPPSREARIARAEALFHLKTGPAEGELTPCDPKGRILDSADGTFCKDNQVCVSALPQDFAKTSDKHSKFCWHYIKPDCPEVKCPDKPYCPPPPKCTKEGKCPPYACPVAPPCPKQPKCPPGIWKDMCYKNRGQPWCVAPELIKEYRRPIEIKCSATGRDIRDKVGSPDGCWWLRKVAKHSGKMDFQRLPGKIKRNYAPAGGWFVTGREPSDKGALPEKLAEKWIEKGELNHYMVSDNNEFLKKKAPPPAGVLETAANAAMGAVKAVLG